MEKEYLRQRFMIAGFGSLLLWVIGIFNVLYNEEIKPVFGTKVIEQKKEETEKEEMISSNLADETLYQLMVQEQEDDIVTLTYLQDAPNIRVLLKDSDFKDRKHENVKITCDASFSVRFTHKGQNTEVFYGAGEMVDFGKYVSWFEEGPVTVNGYGNGLKVLSLDREYGHPIYEGIIEVRKSGKEYVIINEVSIETYLRYVVPSEMPSGYPKEALKAQAICARTYAYRFVQKPGLSSYGAHLDDSVTYQVYNNISPQKSTDKAIEETRGQLLTYDGKLAETYFYSTSCGFGTDISVWNANLDKYPYLQAENHGEQKFTGVEALSSELSYDVPTGQEMQEEAVFVEYITNEKKTDFEADLPWYRWEYSIEKIDVNELEERLKEKYKEKSHLVLTREKDGRFVSKEIGDIKKVKEIWVSNRRPGGAACGLCIQTQDALYQILTENAIRGILCDGETKVVNKEGKKVSFPSLLPSAFFAISTSKEGENVVGYKVIGGGYGHGIGMSQNGASQMAKNGYSSSQILQHFFEGTQLLQMY